MAGPWPLRLCSFVASMRECGRKTILTSGSVIPIRLATVRSETKILAEERHHVVLNAVGYGAGVSTMVDLKTVGDSVLIERFVQLRCIVTKPILITYVDRDRAVLAQVADVL